MKYISKSILWISLITLCLACNSDKKEEEKLVRPVKFQQVGYEGNAEVRTFSGTARADKVINLSFRSLGIVSQLDMKLGQQVKKGQLLSKLDNVQARLNYETAVASLNSAESQMNTAKLSLNRVRSLYEKGSSSLSDFEAAKNSFKTAQQSFESAKRSVAIQQDQIQYGYLYASADGVISSVAVELDENVSSGQIIGVLNAGTDMEISLGLPESVINGVSEGMMVDIDFSSIPATKFKGKVTEVSPAVDVNTTTYPVRITVTDPSSEIKTGMTANVTFDFSNKEIGKRDLIVPAQAVGEDSEGRFVFLVEDDGEITIVKKQRVTIGALSSEGFEIKSGLQAGQKIATAGLQTLLDGQEVQLQSK